MELKEFAQILAGVLIFTVVGSFSYLVLQNWGALPKVFLFSAIIIFLAVFAKKLAAYLLDCDVEHEVWKFSRYGIKQSHYLKKEIPAGIIFPLILTLFSWGIVKFGAILSYEARALKKRAAKRFGPFSFSELTEWHNGLIGAAGMVVLFLLAIVSYLINQEYLTKLTIFYAFWNMIPLPKLDGLQIFFGSRVLYTTLAVVALILAVGAILILHNPLL